MNISALVGRLTKDMEFIPYTNQNTGKTGYKARGTIAVDRKGTGKNGEKGTDFIPVQSWITEAQKEKYHGVQMKKGTAISVNGVIRVESYVDKETQKNRTFTVVQGEMQVVAPPKAQSQNVAFNQGGNGYAQQGGQSFDPSAVLDPNPAFEEIYNDDIPF